MYSYGYDSETGGLLLIASPLAFSKEPRPVYWQELDALGFDKHWKYDRDDTAPFLWAEANCYWYRGRLVAKTKGGNLYAAPELELLEEPEPNGGALRHVDVAGMVSKNRELLTVIEQSTVKRIFDIYKRYRKRLDVFHVAFSGGKDSIVLLELVKKALPRNDFVVVFGDTGMEFPDTYEAVEKTRLQCAADGIAFHIAKSHLDTKESWKVFGPPSQVLRWCCSVHKSAPQTLKLRSLLGKNNFVGMDYVGVRAHESLKRSEYEYENFGKKQQGQHSHNPILEWTSAEIWLYIYANDLLINGAYKKGNSRAGCLFCPMAGGKSDYLRRKSYPDELDAFVALIKDSNGRDSANERTFESYIVNGGWGARRSGRDLKDNVFRCVEKLSGGFLTINVTNPKTDWKEWIKTLGDLISDGENQHIVFDGTQIPFSLTTTNNSYTVALPEQILKEQPMFGKLFRQVFHKAAYCEGCRVCETNCRNGSISFEGGLAINHCVRCHECHNLPYGCLVYDSLKVPQEERIMKSVNCFDDHAPKEDWLVSFFKERNNFFVENSLGPNQFTKFKRFLRDAGLIEKDRFSSTAELVSRLGWESETACGIILANLAGNSQFEWYIRNLEIGCVYPRKTVEEMLNAVGVSDKDAKSIVKSFKRIVETPLGTALRFGSVTESGRNIDTLSRSACVVTEPKVVLFSLFKFAEACKDYRQFTLARLLDHGIASDGISPSQIFGLGRAQMEPLLQGLSTKHSDFISVSFTHDLDKISLADDKTSVDVLGLF